MLQELKYKFFRGEIQITEVKGPLWVGLTFIHYSRNLAQVVSALSLRLMHVFLLCGEIQTIMEQN